MKKTLVLSFLACAFFSGGAFASGKGTFSKKASAEANLESIKNFYFAYLNADHDKPVPASLTRAGTRMFSKVFRDLIRLNRDLCDVKAKGEICGWAAGGDAFLNAQDMDSKLNFANSRFQISELSSSGDSKVIEVSFSVFIDGSDPRKIQYVIKNQEGRWAIEDILYLESDGKVFSTVAGIRKEINMLLDM